MHAYFFEDQLAESSLDSHRKKFVSWQLIVWSLSYCSPQVRIVARQQHLQEVVIVEQLIAIQVEILDHLLEICWLQLAVPVLSLELGYGLGINVTCVTTIDALERSVGLEVAHR